MEIVGIKPDRLSTTITGLEMFRKSLDFAEAGDNIGALLRGVDRTQIERGQVLAKMCIRDSPSSLLRNATSLWEGGLLGPKQGKGPL